MLLLKSITVQSSAMKNKRMNSWISDQVATNFSAKFDGILDNLPTKIIIKFPKISIVESLLNIT